MQKQTHNDWFKEDTYSIGRVQQIERGMDEQ